MRSYRVDKMASTIRNIVGEAMAHRLSDPRISPLASVTRVEVSGDLQLAKVYVSVLGAPAEARRTLAGLTHAVGHVQRMVARQLTVRRCPEVRFLLDDSLKKAANTMRIIDETMKEHGPADAAAPPDDPDAPEEDGT